MGAGANLAKPRWAVTILHGARGLTNATGAIADVRRNEIGVLCIVGLPSTTSAPFLPPHGEHGLIEMIGNFAVWSTEVGVGRSMEDAREFVATLFRAMDRVAARPFGPVIVGIPQDAAEDSWIPDSFLEGVERQSSHPHVNDLRLFSNAVAEIERSRATLVLVDDYFLRHRDAKAVLAEFCLRSGSVVAQVRYRRGPMLFEQVTAADVPYFGGAWPPTWDAKENLVKFMGVLDLLITLEDRNFYPRVVGELPEVRKIAITSVPKLTAKNGYLASSDLLLEGPPTTVLKDITAALGDRLIGPPCWSEPIDPRPSELGDLEYCRNGIVNALIDGLESVESPYLVDDSQTFGGLIAEYYHLLPKGLRVFGDHGGFVGSGAGFAAGLALARAKPAVLCLLGDSGFVNGIQTLGMVGGINPPVTYVVCNNGGSVSLRIQSAYEGDLEAATYLENRSCAHYAEIARGFGIPATSIRIDSWPNGSANKLALDQFRHSLREYLQTGGTRLIELCLPSHPDFWAGLWQPYGLDESPRKYVRR